MTRHGPMERAEDDQIWGPVGAGNIPERGNVGMQEGGRGHLYHMPGVYTREFIPPRSSALMFVVAWSIYALSPWSLDVL